MFLGFLATIMARLTNIHRGTCIRKYLGILIFDVMQYHRIIINLKYLKIQYFKSNFIPFSLYQISRYLSGGQRNCLP